MGQHEIARRLVDGVWTTIDVLEDGGGPGGDWGGSSSAQFSGSGTPVGNVTPSAEGDLYVDTTTPALWQATGLTNADWQQVGQGGSQPVPYWSRDRIVASRDFDGGFVTGAVISLGVDGRGIVQHVPYVTNRYGYSGSFEPTERKLLVFEEYETGPPDKVRVRIVDTETGVVTTLAGPDGVNVFDIAFAPGWNPDGTLISYASKPVSGKCTLRTMAPDGSGSTAIVTPAGVSAAQFSYPAAWSPDGTRLVFNVATADTGADDGWWICDADGGNLSQLVAIADMAGTSQSFTTSWSTKNLLFLGTDAGGWTINPDGTGLVKVTPDAYFGSFSPDGDRVLITDVNADHYYVDLDSGDLTRTANTDQLTETWGESANPFESSVSPVAAFVANGSTVDQLRNSLIAAGLVAPS